MDAPSVSDGKRSPALTNTVTFALRDDRYGPDCEHVVPVLPLAVIVDACGMVMTPVVV